MQRVRSEHRAVAVDLTDGQQRAGLRAGLLCTLHRDAGREVLLVR